jgi:hypothetical protein
MKSLSSLIVLATLSTFAVGQSRPVMPEVFDAKFSPLVRKAAYGAYIAEACGFPSTAAQKFRTLIESFTQGEEKQESLLKAFRDQKREHASGGNLLSTAKPCYIEAAKTRVLISDIESEIEEYGKGARRKVAVHNEAVASWQREQDRKEATRLAEQEAKEKTDREAREALSRLPQLIHSALSCASNFGQVSKVQVTFVEPATNDRINMRGQYVITAFDISAPGSFIAVATKSGRLESLWWKENSRAANVVDRCL